MPKKSTSIKNLEQKFAETAFRLSQERNDFLLPQIIDFVRKDKWLNLHPEYQRRLVWDTTKRSLFIESLLLNIPIPPLFLYEWELGRYEVMDGQQRLNAVVGFYENAFALKGLEKWKEINGLRYKDLPTTLQRGLDRRRLSATVLLVEGFDQVVPYKSDIRKLVFERLNTGGLRLNSQELRNCLYEGKFNDLLIELSRKRLFAELWDIPPYEDNVDRYGNLSETLSTDRLYQRMIDCEIVLRFFAFRKRSHIKGSVRKMLDSCMEENIDLTEQEIDTLRQCFESRLKLAYDIFEERTFRYVDEDGNWKLSQPLYDGIMVALDQLWEKREKLLTKKKEIRNAIEALLRRPKAYEVIIGRPNTAKAIIRRLELLASNIQRAAR
jgi:hypothetical protein